MLSEHLGYLTDTQRSILFKEAIGRTVQPMDHVLDLGCGVAIWGLFCLRAGAARVTALDETAVTELALGTLKRAGFDGLMASVELR